MARVVLTQVEELPENKVRLSVEVPSADVKHAVEHAASDLAANVRIPGFRRGKVPRQVLLARVGRERVFTEAVESHIAGWFRNALASSRVRPLEQPRYLYDVPETEDESFRFTAEFAVLPTPEPADWAELEVPVRDASVPAELVDEELEALRALVGDLAPVAGRPAQLLDTVLVDLVAPDGEAQRDYVVELGAGRLMDEIEQTLVGMSAGETRPVQYELGEGETARIEATVKEISERVLPPLDDDLARTASEFQTLPELRADIEQNLQEQLEADVEAEFRAAAIDRLVEASNVEASGPLVDGRTRELLEGLAASLERRGIALDTFLAVSNRSPDDLIAGLRTEAARSVARELVLEAVADRLAISVSDDEVRTLVREQADAAGEDDPAAIAEEVVRGPAAERLREDLRLRRALDRVAAEVKRIPAELAAAREKLWTPERGAAPGDTKLWTPGTKEPA